jgi:hypothetical protein
VGGNIRGRFDTSQPHQEPAVATSANLKQAAQDERDSLRKVLAGADLAIAGVAAAALAVAPAIGVVGLIPAVIRWRTTKELVVQERLVEDPPRWDFEEPVQPDFEHVSLALPEELSPLTTYIEGSVKACAFEEAMIASIEKALGAEERGRRAHARKRSQEAGTFAEQAAEALEQVATSQEQIPNLVPSGELFWIERWLEELEDWTRPASPLEALPIPVAAWLFRAGAPADAFRTWTSEESKVRDWYYAFWRPLYEDIIPKRKLAQELQAL